MDKPKAKGERVGGEPAGSFMRLLDPNTRYWGLMLERVLFVNSFCVVDVFCSYVVIKFDARPMFSV